MIQWFQPTHSYSSIKERVRSEVTKQLSSEASGDSHIRHSFQIKAGKSKVTV